MTNEGRLALVLKKGSAAVAPETASLTADVLLFSGTPSYSWSVTGSAATIANTSGTDNTVPPVQGGISTVTVTADLGDRTLTASLAGIPALADAAYEWQVESPTVALASGTEGESVTITPAGPGTTAVKVRASYQGVATDWCSLPLKVVDFVLKEASAELGAEAATYPALTKCVMREPPIGHADLYIHVTPSDLQPAGTDEVCTWSVAGGVASGNEAHHRTGWNIDALAGGQGTLTVSVDFGSRTLTKELDVYVLEPEITGTSPSGQALSADNTNPTILAGGDERAMSMSVSLKNLDWSVLGDDLHVNWGVEEGYGEALTLTPDESNDRYCTVLAGNLPDGYTGAPIYLKAEVSYGEDSLHDAQAKSYVKLVGLRLVGEMNYLILDHSAGPDGNQLMFDLELVGIDLLDIGTTLAFNSSDINLATAETSSVGATVRCRVTAAKSGGAFTYATGAVTITADATAGPDALPLSYKKEIPVLDLVVKQGERVLSDNVAIAKNATADLTAELKGVETGVEYTWDFADPSIISGSTIGPTTTITSYATEEGTYITVEADWSSDYDPVSLGMTWFVGFTGDLDTFRDFTFASTTSATPCTVNIDVSSQEDLDAIASAIGNPDDPNFKGVPINLDLSGETVDIGDDTFKATDSNAGLATYLTGIELPYGSIGNNAFKGCANLSSVTLPSFGLNTIGFNAFNGCGLSGTLTIPASCTCIGSGAFAGTSITSLTEGASPARTWERWDTINDCEYAEEFITGLLYAIDLTKINTYIPGVVFKVAAP